VETLKEEIGGSWAKFLLSIPLNVITFLSLVIVSGSLVWKYVGEPSGRNPALILLIAGPLFLLYYVSLRRVLLENPAAAAAYFLTLAALLVLLPVIPLPAAPVIMAAVCAFVLARYDAAEEGEDENARRDREISIPMESVYSNINGVYVQQFLANTVSTFEAYRALYRAGKTGELPAMISAYPRRLLDRQLEKGHVEAVVREISRETGLAAGRVNDYINFDLKAFAKTQRETTVFGYEKVNIREVADKMEQAHPELLYGSRPLHYEDLKRVCEAEGLEVINLKGLEVLAGLITYTDKAGRQQYAILMRGDDDVHQALREFALAHELGHWFAHIKGQQQEKIQKIEVFLNSLHDLGQFEDEANKVALITLFPTPYLSLRNLESPLHKEDILADYLAEMSEPERRPPHEQLRENMLGFIKLRIENYEKHRYTWLWQPNLPDVPVVPEVVDYYEHATFRLYPWAELDNRYTIVEANEKFAEMVGLTREELLSGKLNILELSEPGWREVTKKQLEKKRGDLAPKFYVTWYRNLKTGEVFPVTIYSLAIVEDLKSMKYVGSFGIVTDIHRKRRGSD
jgi:PAS domain S-box-containing protein